jgi:hypothetical protein
VDLLAVNLEDPASYLTWGWLSISIPNLIIALVIVGLFVGALLIPFPKGRDD